MVICFGSRIIGLSLLFWSGSRGFYAGVALAFLTFILGNRINVQNGVAGALK
jgi:hypothetical protein